MPRYLQCDQPVQDRTGGEDPPKLGAASASGAAGGTGYLLHHAPGRIRKSDPPPAEKGPSPGGGLRKGHGRRTPCPAGGGPVRPGEDGENGRKGRPAHPPAHPQRPGHLGTPAGPYPPVRERELLLEALQLTVSGFDVSRIDNFRYTQEETEIINKIAITYTMEGDRRTAIVVYRQLLSYIQENNQQLSRYANQLTLVAYNYARELDVDGQYDEAVRAAELGRKAAVQYGYYQFLPGLLHILAECWHYLGKDEKSKELYFQAFYVYKAYESRHGLEILKKDALEQLGLTLS